MSVTEGVWADGRTRAKVPDPGEPAPVRARRRARQQIQRATIQARLSVGSASDRYEQEADQVADIVIRAMQGSASRGDGESRGDQPGDSATADRASPPWYRASRIQRATSSMIDRASPAESSVSRIQSFDPTSGPIQRKGGRDRDRRKGREEQRRRAARDRKVRGDDDGAGARNEVDDARQREEGGRRWEDAHQARKANLRQQREEDRQRLQEELDQADDEAEEEERLQREEEEREQQEEEERKRKEDEERKRQEDEERQRQEADAKRKEDEERKRLEAEEVKRQEDEARKRKEDEERQQQEADAKRKAEQASTEYAATGLSPDAFRLRATNFLELAGRTSSDPFYRSKISKATKAVATAVSKAVGLSRTTMEGRFYNEALADLKAVDQEMKTVKVDPLQAVREQAMKRAREVLVRAKTLPTIPKKSPAQALVARLQWEAAQNEDTSKLEHMMKTPVDIEKVRAVAAAIDRQIDTAFADLALFPLLNLVPGAAYPDLQHLLALLRAELTDNEIATLVPLVNPATIIQSASHLVDAAKFSKQVPAVGVVGLGNLIPICQLPRLPNAIVLAGHLGLALPFFTANYAMVETVSTGFSESDLAWFHGLTWPTVLSLHAAFGNALPAFGAAIPRARLDIMLQHNVAPAWMQHWFGADKARLLRWGATDKVWKHLTTTKISKASGQISGGHDKAQFDAFYANLLTWQWSEVVPKNVLPHATLAGVEVVTYRLRDPKGNVHNGGKTLITGLAAGAATWRPQIERAAWNAITSAGSFQGTTWRGTDPTTGVVWTGFFNNSAIDTAYPA